MSESAKYFIVTPDQREYGRIIAERKLDPGRCFWCATLAEAHEAKRRNEAWGLEVVIIMAGRIAA